MKYSESNLTIITFDGDDAEKLTQRSSEDATETIKYIIKNDKEADIDNLETKTHISIVDSIVARTI
ncbi:MAG: hypothetical protein OXH39_12885 [Candidatus Poribacteria bacterium]|nr:hypothetical protein [Candidatus Poribacteria bacterium]